MLPKGSVAFYNFSSVGQNFVDNFASGADYVDAVIPYLTFINGDTAFAVADNRLVIYSGDQRPKSTADVSLEEEIQSIFYNENLHRSGIPRHNRCRKTIAWISIILRNRSHLPVL